MATPSTQAPVEVDPLAAGTSTTTSEPPAEPLDPTNEERTRLIRQQLAAAGKPPRRKVCDDYPDGQHRFALSQAIVGAGPSTTPVFVCPCGVFKHVRYTFEIAPAELPSKR